LRLAASIGAMQMLEHPWGVTAYGAASVKSIPDLVRMRFRVVRVEPTPAKAFGSASDLIKAIRRALRAHGLPDAAVNRSRLDLMSNWSYGKEPKLLGYQCQASFAVESTDLDGVQRLLVDLVAAGANEIQGVDFDVAGKGELRAEARRQAVAAARRKAELYAEAAGVRLGAVVHIDDVDPDRVGVERYRAQGTSGQASEEDLAPGHVVVSAAVVLGFSIVHDRAVDAIDASGRRPAGTR
jgi:uncharacterized protein YggE